MPELEEATKGIWDELVIKGIRWPSLVRCAAQVDGLQALPCSSNDVFVCTYPKCGTHWVHKICQLILNREMFITPVEFNPWHEGPAWKGKGVGRGDLLHASLDPPRIMATHVPFSFLPGEAKTKRARLVYVVRDPKDVLVSYYHWRVDPPPFDVFVKRFLSEAETDTAKATAGGAMYGGYAAHVLEFVAAAKAGANIHLMSYENLHADPDFEISALAKFLGKELTGDKITAVREASSFKSMKKGAQLEEETMNYGQEPALRWSSVLYRKGIIGDGLLALTAEQVAAVNASFAPSFGTLSELFPSM